MLCSMNGMCPNKEHMEIYWIEITPVGDKPNHSEQWDFGENHSRK